MTELVLHPIGVVHSPWKQAEGTPVQSFCSRYEQGGWPGGEQDHQAQPHSDERGGRGTIEIDTDWREALCDLGEFSHLWAIFWIDRALPPRPKVKPYRDTVERGLFSTRSPMRPNPIGLSCLEIVSVVDRFVHVVGLDILDGTPLLDIKPYIPDYDSFRLATRGWLESGTAQERVVRADNRFYAG